MNLSAMVELIGPDKYSSVERDLPRLDDEDEVTHAKQLLFGLTQLGNLEPFDAALATLQNPGARFMRTRDQWADVGGWPLAGATPISLTNAAGAPELLYSDRDVQAIGERKTLSEFKAGKDSGIRGTRKRLAAARVGALRLATDIHVTDEPAGVVEFPGAAIDALTTPAISEFRDELLVPADRPIVFRVSVSSQLNRRQLLARIIRCFASIILQFPNPWRSLSAADQQRVDTLIDDAFGGRFPDAVQAAWAVLRDRDERVPKTGESVQFEVGLCVWIVKKRLGVRFDHFDRHVEVFIADPTSVAPAGVQFPRVLRAATLVERALSNEPIGLDLQLPEGSGSQIMALVDAER